MAQTFPSGEKLKSKKLIDDLFQGNGLTIKKFPVMCVYKEMPEGEKITQAGFSVSKRNFKKAVDRNKLKRRMREAYRLNKELLEPLPSNYYMMFIYLAKDFKTFDEINLSMLQVFEELKIRNSGQS